MNPSVRGVNGQCRLTKSACRNTSSTGNRSGSSPVFSHAAGHDHPQSEDAGHLRHLAADVAVADDAQHPALELETRVVVPREDRALLPVAHARPLGRTGPPGSPAPGSAPGCTAPPRRWRSPGRCTRRPRVPWRMRYRRCPCPWPPRRLSRSCLAEGCSSRGRSRTNLLITAHRQSSIRAGNSSVSVSSCVTHSPASSNRARETTPKVAPVQEHRAERTHDRPFASGPVSSLK